MFTLCLLGEGLATSSVWIRCILFLMSLSFFILYMFHLPAPSLLAPSLPLQDTHNCAFFLKTGACRFGDRCSKQHPRPASSVTLLIPGMFESFGLKEQMLDERDQDTGLEVSDQQTSATPSSLLHLMLVSSMKESSLPSLRHFLRMCCLNSPKQGR